MKSSICIIGLSNSFTKLVTKMLAEWLEMFYADVNELLEYDLFDIKQAEKKSGRDYILKLESSKVKNVSSFENTVFTLSYASLTNKKNYELIKNNSLVIYLKMTENSYRKQIDKDKTSKSKRIISTSVFKDRDLICSKISDITVNVKMLNAKSATKNVIKAIDKFYSEI